MLFRSANVMGVARFDSDGDDESDTKKAYFMDWKEEDGVRIHTINRESGKVRVWQLPLAFVLSQEGNAYDTDGKLQTKLLFFGL